MVNSQTVLNAISRGIRQSGRLPQDTSYIVGEPDPTGKDASVPLPAVVVGEVVTIRDDSHTTDLVGYETDEDGSRIGRIWQANYDMDTQIDIHTASGAGQERSLDTLEQNVRRALQRYDSQMRSDFLPDGEGGTHSAIRELTINDTQPENDLTTTPSLMRHRFSVSVSYVDRLNEVEEFGPIPTIKTVLTPRHGDFTGELSEDYELEFQPQLDRQEAVEESGFQP